MPSLTDVLSRGIRSPDAAEGRLFGPLIGVVTDVETSSSGGKNGLGRVKARFGAMAAHTQSHWLSPLWMGGCEGQPEVGEKVVIFFVDGNPNWGHYMWFPESTTTGRPIDAMLLGTTFVGMYNDLVAKFNALKSAFNALVDKHNDLKSDHNTFITSYNTHKHAGVTTGSGETAVPSATGTASTATGSKDNDADAGKGMNADRSVIDAIASDSVVLSKRGKVK